MSKYYVLESIEHESKVTNFVYARDFFFLLMYGSLTFVLQYFVNTRLKLLYFIMSSIFAIYLTLPSIYNKGRRNYETLILSLKNNSTVYYSVGSYEEVIGGDDD